MKTEGSGSGSISQRHGSADPDKHQNFMDPQHWTKMKISSLVIKIGLEQYTDSSKSLDSDLDSSNMVRTPKKK